MAESLGGNGGFEHYGRNDMPVVGDVQELLSKEDQV